MLTPGVPTEAWKASGGGVGALADLARRAVSAGAVPDARATPSAWKEALAADPLAAAVYVRVTEGLTPARGKVFWAYMNRLTAPLRAAAPPAAPSEEGTGAAVASVALQRCGVFAVARYVTAICSGTAAAGGAAGATTALGGSRVGLGASASASASASAPPAPPAPGPSDRRLSAGVGPDMMSRPAGGPVGGVKTLAKEAAAALARGGVAARGNGGL
jgi:hypothetical protein